MLRGVGKQQVASALGALLLGAAACAPADSPPAAPAEGLVLEGVSLWHHQDERLVARATARSVAVAPDLTQAHLFTTRLELPEAGMRASAPTARADFTARELSGAGGIRVESGDAVLTGPEFTLDLGTGDLAITGGVQAQGAIAP